MSALLSALFPGRSTSKIKVKKIAKSEFLRIKSEDFKIQQKAVCNLMYLKTYKKEKMKLDDLLYTKMKNKLASQIIQ